MTVPPVVDLRICDDSGNEVALDAAEVRGLWAAVGGFDAATVSACPGCRSRVLASVAVVDVLDRAAPHPLSGVIAALADDAPTLHLYVDDATTNCVHRAWRDPLAEEWTDLVVGPARRPIR